VRGHPPLGQLLAAVDVSSVQVLAGALVADWAPARGLTGATRRPGARRWAILQNAGGYSPEAAKAAALQVLPDILHYHRTKPATYPNGRIPTDDGYSIRFAWLTNGKVPPSGLKPHDDLLAHFPYLGPPNP
jgi:hypothetical protein